jgi:two-component system alkaline phosphatase synthesis response regulator PhoP
MSPQKIVVIEDEADILEVIEYNLSREGFRVISCRDGEEGLRVVQSEVPGIVLLDLMLPGIDGIEICRTLRGDPVTRRIPIIMVTAKGEESEIVLGLGVGADDYMVKPFSPKELVARVKAVLRRGPMQEDLGARGRVVRGPLSIDPTRHEARVGGTSISLTPTEFRLLHFLASHPGRVFTRDQLLNHVLGEDAIIIDRNIDVHVRSIRRKLGPRQDMIETIRGVGYRFTDEEG